MNPEIVFSVRHRHVSSSGECRWLWTEPVSCKCSKWRPLAFPHARSHPHSPWGSYWHTMQRNIVLKYRQIPTRNAGEEAFLRKNHDVTIMTSSGYVTLSKTCPIDSPQAISYRQSIGTIAYLASFPRYLAPKLRQRLLCDDVINDVIRPVSTIREEHIDTPYTGILY